MGVVVAGVGIRGPEQVSAEVEAALRAADVVFHCLGDPATVRWVRSLARAEHDLIPLYADGAPRLRAYRAMADLVLGQAAAGAQVALAVPGHPCLLHTGVQLTVRGARRARIPVTILPGISSVDMLLALVGVDPGFGGLQVLEATDLLLYHRGLQADGHVVILQPACIGPRVHRAEGHHGQRAGMLVDRLVEVYPAGHAALHFRISAGDSAADALRWTTVGALAGERWSNASSLYLPPALASKPDPDIAARLGMALPPPTAAERAGGVV